MLKYLVKGKDVRTPLSHGSLKQSVETLYSAHTQVYAAVQGLSRPCDRKIGGTYGWGFSDTPRTVQTELVCAAIQ